MQERMEREKEDEVLFVLRKSRKAHLTEYLCGIALIALLIALFTRGTTLLSAYYLVGGFAVFAIVSAEVSRLITRYRVMGTKLVIIKGIVKQSKKNVYFHPLAFVPDLNVKQTRLGRMLNFGTIYLKTGAEPAFEIKDIDNPHGILDHIEDLIEKNIKR